MASEKNKKIEVYFCPKCESVDVKYIFGLGNIFGMVPKQKCGECGLESSIFPILVTDNEEIKRVEAKNKSMKKNTRGKNG